MNRQNAAQHGGYRLERVAIDELPGWVDDDPSAIFPALTSVAAHLAANKPYRTGSLGLTAADLHPLLERAADFHPADAQQARDFFRETCVAFRIVPEATPRGFVTGFYEPEIDVRSGRDEEWCFPFYRRPDDLVDIDDSNRPSHMDPACMFARDMAGDLDYYPDRQAIDCGFLEGRGLEIAWSRSKVDVFFAHVQGAAQLRFPDGKVKRITYAAKAGHAFSAIGRRLIELGEIDPVTVSMQTIRAWLAAHPGRVDSILWHNRSYIFFREAAVANAASGPVAAAKVPLVAGRSLAVDRTIHTFGFPFFVNAPDLLHPDRGRPFARLMLALDTGSAIVGPARGDIFTGSGDEAGEQAGTIRNQADFYILVPAGAAERFV